MSGDCCSRCGALDCCAPSWWTEGAQCSPEYAEKIGRLMVRGAEMETTARALADLLSELRARDPREVVRETFAALAPLDRGTLLDELCSIHRKASPGSAAREVER